MRSSSLTTTILNENGHTNECLLETTKENNNHQKERRSTPIVIDKLVFKTSKLNPNASYWTVTDRQTEWYKLTVPVNQPSHNYNNNTNQLSLTVPYRLLPNIFERKKSNSNINDQIDELTYVCRLRRFISCKADYLELKISNLKSVIYNIYGTLLKSYLFLSVANERIFIITKINRNKLGKDEQYDIRVQVFYPAVFVYDSILFYRRTKINW